MAVNNQDPLSLIGDQTYVDFIAVSQSLAQAAANAATPAMPTGQTGSQAGTGISSGARPRTQGSLQRSLSQGSSGSQSTASTTSRSLSRRSWAPGGLRPRMTAVARHSFIPITEDELEFKKDDTLEIISTDHRWWLARNPNTGKEGYIPSNHVHCDQPVVDEWAAKVKKRRHMSLAKLNRADRGQTLVEGRADFYAQTPSEISFKQGDLFVVLNALSNWWFVRHLATGREGFVPEVYVQKFDWPDEFDGGP